MDKVTNLSAARNETPYEFSSVKKTGKIIMSVLLIHLANLRKNSSCPSLYWGFEIG
jgi:hypothetical protein